MSLLAALGEGPSSEGPSVVSGPRVPRVPRVHWVHWVRRVQQVGRKIRITFDGKVGEVDRTEQSIEAQLAAFREAIEAASAGGLPELEPADPLWRRVLGPAAEFGALLLALGVVAGLLYGAALLARLGWETGA